MQAVETVPETGTTEPEKGTEQAKLFRPSQHLLALAAALGSFKTEAEKKAFLEKGGRNLPTWHLRKIAGLERAKKEPSTAEDSRRLRAAEMKRRRKRARNLITRACNLASHEQHGEAVKCLKAALEIDSTRAAALGLSVADMRAIGA